MNKAIGIMAILLIGLMIVSVSFDIYLKYCGV